MHVGKEWSDPVTGLQELQDQTGTGACTLAIHLGLGREWSVVHQSTRIAGSDWNRCL